MQNFVSKHPSRLFIPFIIFTLLSLSSAMQANSAITLLDTITSIDYAQTAEALMHHTAAEGLFIGAGAIHLWEAFTPQTLVNDFEAEGALKKLTPEQEQEIADLFAKLGIDAEHITLLPIDKDSWWDSWEDLQNDPVDYQGPMLIFDPDFLWRLDAKTRHAALADAGWAVHHNISKKFGTALVAVPFLTHYLLKGYRVLMTKAFEYFVTNYSFKDHRIKPMLERIFSAQEYITDSAFMKMLISTGLILRYTHVINNRYERDMAAINADNEVVDTTHPFDEENKSD